MIGWSFWKGAFLCFAAVRCAAQVGFDTGLAAPALDARLAPDDPLIGHSGLWLRIRGAVDPETGSANEVERERTALASLHARGFHTCVLLMCPATAWSSGVRNLAGARLPLDLREPEAWLARLSGAYRGLVDVWEIDNEPDIGFLAEDAETYASFLKACYWGAAGQESRVLMAALAMPPGPYFRRLMANGFLGYTDGFNYHYYGYAVDFTGVYRQFEDAADEDFGTPTSFAVRRPKRLPIFITEFGYGLLDGTARNTVEGRKRQLDWFREVATQVRTLRIGASMAFLLTPYYERNHNEFGLTAPAASLTGLNPTAFGAQADDRWWRTVGRPVAGEPATPALAWLLTEAGRSSEASYAWNVQAPEPSPVVIDFVANSDLRLIKNKLGMMFPSDGRGHGELRLYNFSATAITGTLQIDDAVQTVSSDGKPLPIVLTLQPDELKKLALRIVAKSNASARCEWNVSFRPQSSATPSAVFHTAFLVNTSNVAGTTCSSFEFTGAAAEGNRRFLLRRALAPGEPQLAPLGRWLVTPGVDVREVSGAWIFKIVKLPPEPLRPAMAELPLPEAFRFSGISDFHFQYRLPTGSNAAMQDRFDVYFRTANGNLYLTWPPLIASSGWQSYAQNGEDFTMAFFGRAKLPWRFEENTPVSLVFFFRPRSLPATYEIRDAELVLRK